MDATAYLLIYDHVINQLLAGLSEKLTYHSIYHTLDVLEQCQRIAGEEGIADEHELYLLKTAALYHDTGFLHTYKGHEEAGYKLAMQFLPAYGFSGQDLKKIGGMILATQLPQTPRNKMEEIICDADLDYLGRPDFFSIAQLLYVEMKEKNLVNTQNEWNRMQVKFIKEHRYFTHSNQQARDPRKKRHCEMLESDLLKRKD